MFLGNFLIGSLKPTQQVELIQAKNLKKLQIFCKKERLNKTAEAYLIEHSEGLETLLDYSLKKYGAFQEDNNDLFFKYHRTNKELLLQFLQVVQPNFDYMTEMLYLSEHYPQQGECFKQCFHKLSEADKVKFVKQLKQDNNLFCIFWKIIPLKITEVSLFEAFLDYYKNQSDVLKSYLIAFNLPQNFQKLLFKKQLWHLITFYADVHQDFLVSDPQEYCSLCNNVFQMKFNVTVSAEAGIFENKNEALLLNLASQRRFQHHENEMKFLLMGKKYPQNVRQYLVRYEQDIMLTEEEKFAIIRENISLIFALKEIPFQIEALLFEEENKFLLLEYASQRRFQHHGNEVKFLSLGKKYPQEVRQYLAQQGQDVKLTEGEQLDIIKENIGLIFILKNVFLKTEALLFEAENKFILQKYASQRRFQHHENEMRFLLLGKEYPVKVKQYLAQYGKNIDLTEEELVEIFQHHKNGIEYLRVQSPILKRDYVFAEKRRKRISYSEDDFSMFIRLSTENPSLLEHFLEKHGKLSPKREAELFFMTDGIFRDEYIKEHGIDLKNLMKYAPQYGATPEEQKIMNDEYSSRTKALENSGFIAECCLFPRVQTRLKSRHRDFYTYKEAMRSYCGNLHLNFNRDFSTIEILATMLENIARRNYLLCVN